MCRRSGERPPWTQKMVSFMSAAIGSASKTCTRRPSSAAIFRSPTHPTTSRPHRAVAILDLALFVKAVLKRNAPRLVVAAQQRHVFRIASENEEQVGERLEAVVAAIHVVCNCCPSRRRERASARPTSKKDVFGLCRIARHAYELHEIVELAMDVAADCDRRPQRNHCRC